MPDYRSRPRRPDSSAASSSSGASAPCYHTPPRPAPYAPAPYAPAPAYYAAAAHPPPAPHTPYGHYAVAALPFAAPAPPAAYARADAVPRHHAPPRPDAERAAKRRRAAEWDGSVSSGYGSPPAHPHAYAPRAQPLWPPPAPAAPPCCPAHPFSDDDEHVDHGPTELPPRRYSGKSQYDPPKKPGKIPGSAMDYLPILEARFDRLETAIDRYVDYRGQRALSNSILPGMDPADGASAREGARHPRASSRR